MNSNLNSLSLEEIQELEKYVRIKLPNEYDDAKRLFSDLKSGKLKNKNVEVDSLNFICEGLSEAVEDWLVNQKFKDDEKNTMSELEKIICAETTKVGKFLRTDKRKQITFEKGIKRLKKEGKLNSVISLIAELQSKSNYFDFASHDLEHTQRVLINCDMIMSLKGKVSESERNSVLKATQLHDTGRIHDYEDKIHGQRAVDNLTNELDEFSEEEKDLIKFIMIEHCKSVAENEVAISVLNKSEEEKRKYRRCLNYMKDADKLDRLRFPEIHPLMTDSLDPNRLVNEEAKYLIKFACELLEKSEALFESKNNKSLETLFKRTEKFAEYEEGEELKESVEKILIENGYPKRSSRLDMQEVKQIQEKFMRDGYLYLFRGSRKGQMSGFYTYQYSKEKQTVEQYLEKHPEETAYSLARRQAVKGRERYISTTTDLWVALGFSKFSKTENTEGSIYIIKIKPEEVYRAKSPLEEVMSILGKIDEKNGTEDESEYLIPDYIRPDEIIKEFDCRDLIGIYDFMKSEIGLDITLDDINIPKKYVEKPEVLEEILEEICSRNQLLSNAWITDSETILKNSLDFGFDMFDKMMQNPVGKKIINEMIAQITDNMFDNIDFEKFKE